uniref:Uncharacterized protein n=1 Tax=Hemiselmis tepida TaxID=464990 RepID=A0A7S0YUY6_9CRYP
MGVQVENFCLGEPSLPIFGRWEMEVVDAAEGLVQQVAEVFNPPPEGAEKAAPVEEGEEGPVHKASHEMSKVLIWFLDSIADGKSQSDKYSKDVTHGTKEAVLDAQRIADNTTRAGNEMVVGAASDAAASVGLKIGSEGEDSQKVEEMAKQENTVFFGPPGLPIGA